MTLTRDLPQKIHSLSPKADTNEWLFRQSQTVIPGGVNSPVRAFKAIGGTPVFFERGKGAYLFDVEGRSYVDYVGSWGPMILGHAHPKVSETIAKAAKRAISFGAPTRAEFEMAELITQIMPHLDLVRFVNSGTEATMTALRLARGYTGRDKILKFEGGYHGHSDSLLVNAGSGLLTLGVPSSAGIPKAIAKTTLIAPYNDIEAVETLFETHGPDIAGVIIEPIAANMNCIPALPQFLERLQTLCQQYGSILIFDEVITGFRIALGGAITLYPSIRPQLTCLGKIIGGGLPVGAVGGQADIMECLSPLGPVYQAGTLSGNPICMAAGLQTLRLLRDNPEYYRSLQIHTKALCQGLSDLAQEAQIPFTIQQVGSLFGIFFNDRSQILNLSDVKAGQIERFNHFYHEMLKQGIYLAPSAYEAGFVSTSHDTLTLDQTLSAARVAFSQILSKESVLHEHC